MTHNTPEPPADPLEEFQRLAAQAFTQVAVDLGIPDEVIQDCIKRATADWSAERVESPSVDDHPLEESRFGHWLQVSPPFVPESAPARKRREQREAGFMWAIRAHAAVREGTDVTEPPPQRVTVLELLEQHAWWREQDRDTPPEPNEVGQPFLQVSPGATRPIRVATPDEPTDPAFEPVPVMTHTHRLALITWLQRRAVILKDRAVWSLLGLISGPLGPSGDMATDACNREMDELQREAPLHWLERQPLVRRLRRLTTPSVDDPRLAWHPADDCHDRPPHRTVVLVVRRGPDGQPDYDRPLPAYFDRSWRHADGILEPNFGGTPMGVALYWSWCRDEQINQLRDQMVPRQDGVSYDPNDFDEDNRWDDDDTAWGPGKDRYGSLD